jgi:hypothetical protein
METGAVRPDSRMGALFFGMLLCSFQRLEGMFRAFAGTLFGKLGTTFNSAENVP